MMPDFTRRDRLQDTRKQLVHIGTIFGHDLYVELQGDPDLKEHELAKVREAFRQAFQLDMKWDSL